MERKIQLSDKDQFKIRVDGLSPIVKCYLSLGVALENPVLTNEEQKHYRALRVETLKAFNPFHTAELTSFVDFRNEYDRKSAKK
jgi:hypothetical protein